MDDGDPLEQLIAEAERLDELGDTAELMDDPAGAARFHQEAARRRDRALTELDRRSHDRPDDGG